MAGSSRGHSVAGHMASSSRPATHGRAPQGVFGMGSLCPATRAVLMARHMAISRAHGSDRQWPGTPMCWMGTYLGPATRPCTRIGTSGRVGCWAEWSSTDICKLCMNFRAFYLLLCSNQSDSCWRSQHLLHAQSPICESQINFMCHFVS